MTLQDLVTGGRARLIRAGIPPREAGLDAEVLARHALGWDQATWIANRRVQAPAEFGPEFEQLIARRERREPVPFITGRREFWGLDFEVSPAVLIPRPETELIVEEARALFPDDGAPIRIVDVGTGSGCLAIALAREFPRAAVSATDLSPDALEIAKRNAARHGVADRIRFLETSFLTAFEGTADLIVSNPPYVPSSVASGLQPEVRDHEPALALYGGLDGLDSFRQLFVQARRHLVRSGWLLVEFGLGQEPSVRPLAAEAGWTIAQVREDLQGIARVAVLTKDEELTSNEITSNEPA